MEFGRAGKSKRTHFTPQEKNIQVVARCRYENLLGSNVCNPIVSEPLFVIQTSQHCRKTQWLSEHSTVQLKKGGIAGEAGGW